MACIMLSNNDLISQKMRVIAGKYKYKKIERELKGLKTDFRPTKSIVRESVFNIISNYEMKGVFTLKGANVLDAFCGSGAYGIEALSRGADTTYFVNKHSNELALARRNIESLGDDELDAHFIVADATKLDRINAAIDLIFIDPPYYKGLWCGCLEAIRDNLTLNDGHLIILELAIREDFELIEGFNCLNNKVYGNTKIYVLQKKVEEK